DDAAADDDKGARQLGQVHDLVAIDDGAAVDGNLVGGGRPGADSNDDAGGIDGGVCLRPFDADGLRVDEVSYAVDDIDAVAGELGFGDVDFGLDHALDAEGQIGHGDFF